MVDSATMSTTRPGVGPRARSIRWGAGAFALALIVSGCGGSSSGGKDAGGPGGTQVGQGGAPVALPNCPVGAFQKAAEPTEVLVWYELSGKTETTLKKLVDQYNGSQAKVKVRVEKQGASYKELLRKFEEALPSKNLPDMIITEDTTFRFMVDSDTVLPAQACFDAEKMSTAGFVKTAVSHYSLGGVLYPASASISDVLTYYNRSHFRQAGLDPDKAPATLDEVRAYAEKIKAAGVVDKPVVLKMASWFIETQLTGDKQPVVDNGNGAGPGQTTQATFDTAETHELFTWIKKMTDDGLLQAVPDTDGQVDHYLALAGQKSSITIESSTSATSIKAFLGGDKSVVSGADTGSIDPKALDIGAGPVFGVKGPGRAQIGGNAFFILKTSSEAKQSAAWDFMKWWNQPDQQVTWHLEGSYLPFLAAASQDPRVQTFWKNDIAGRWLAIANEEFTNGVDPAFTGPVIGPYDKFRAAIATGMDSVAFKSADPKAAVAQAAQDTTAALKAYNDGGF